MGSIRKVHENKSDIITAGSDSAGRSEVHTEKSSRILSKM